MTGLLDRFLHSSASVKLREEIADEEHRLTQRRQLAEQLQKANKARETQGPLLAQQFAAKEAAGKKAWEDYRLAERKVNEELVQLRGKITALDCEADRLAGLLMRSASPRIQVLLDELLAEETATRRALQTSLDTELKDAGFDHRGRPTSSRRNVVHSNRSAVMSRIESIRAAREAAEALKLQALDEPELIIEIAKLRSSVPPIELLEMQTTTA